MADPHGYKFDKDARNVMNLQVPIWAVWAILTVLLSGAISLTGMLFTINAKLDVSWSMSDAREYSSDLEKANKGITAPDVYGIHRRTRP